MRIRGIAAAVAIVAIVASATPAHANVGTTCGAWKTTKTGGHQSACTVRSANWEVAARGRGYYEARVRDSYRRQAREQNWILLDGERGRDDVFADVLSGVMSRLGLP